MFITGTANIHSSQRNLLLDVKLKVWNMSKVSSNTVPNHEKNSLVLCFQSCGWYYTWKNGSCSVLDRSPMFWTFIPALIIKAWRTLKCWVGLMPRIDIASCQFLTEFSHWEHSKWQNWILKNLRVKFRNACYNPDNSILFHFANSPAT
jgi:hypothetical protein